MYPRNKGSARTTTLRLPVWLLSASLLAGASLARALPPEHEIQRLMLAVEESVDDESWGRAAEYLNRLQRIEGQKPSEYLYFRGRVMAHSEHYNEALSALENYIAGTGADGEHYTEALKLITEIERARGAQGSRSGDSSDEPVAEITPASDQSTESLRKRYSVDSDRAALVAHLNALLERAGWRRDARLIREGSKPDVLYQVTVDNGVIRFREARTGEEGNRQLTTHELSVYGIGPTQDWSCENNTNSCWIYDPRDNSRFLQLGSNRDLAGEVASTLGRLIRVLQQPSGRS